MSVFTKADASYEFGQFTQLTHTSVSALRFYTDVKLLEPALINPDSGYCHYVPQQVALVERISALRGGGFAARDSGELF